MIVLSGRAPFYIFSIIVAMLHWPTAADAQQRVPLTVAEAEDIALASEPGGEALRAQASALQERAIVAGQLPDPTLRVGLANYPISGGGFSTEGMTQAQLGVRQAFPRAREFDADRMNAQAEVVARRADARHLDVLTSVREAWLEAYYAEQATRLVNASRPLFEDLVAITQSLYSVGRSSQHDVLRAELELSRLEDRLIDVSRARAEAEASLSRWLGLDARRPIAPTLPNWDMQFSLEDLRAGLDMHPALIAADAGISARDAAVRVAEENKKPGWALDLGYGYREGYLPTGEPRSDFISLAVTVELPFFSKNRQDRNLAAALGERSAAASTRADLRARLASQLDAEYARWTDLTRRLELYESRILQQSDSQVQAALRAYQSDTGSFSDVMLAQIDDLNTRLEHIRLQVERAQSYAVLANLGGLE
jgi:outer membrane protein TolC